MFVFRRVVLVIIGLNLSSYVGHEQAKRVREQCTLSIVISNKLKSQTNPSCSKQRHVTVDMAEEKPAPSSSNQFFCNLQSTVPVDQNNQPKRPEQTHQSNFVVNPASFVHLTNYGSTWPMWQTQRFPYYPLVNGYTQSMVQPQFSGNNFRQRYRNKTTNVGGHTMNGLRFWEKIPTKKSASGFEFTVMTYNILAQDLLDQHLYLYTSHTKESLKWRVRWNNLLTEISQLKPDILCLQEVQKSHLKSYFSELKNLGYCGVYKQRTGGIHTDGCAIYYKSEKIKLVEHVTVEYNQRNVDVLNRDNVGIIARFAPKTNLGKEFVVATTHLLYNPKRQDVRLAQTQVLLTEIDRIAFTSGSKYLPVILTGDLNVSPDSAVYQFITKGKLKYDHLAARSLQSGGAGPKTGKTFLPKSLRITDQCQHANLLPKREKNVSISRSEELKIVELKHTERQSVANERNSDKDDANLFSSGTIRHGFSFKSVYQHYVNQDCEATTYQDRWISVDYIFYSEHRPNAELILLERYRLPTDRELGNLTFPNAQLGSDHLSLSAKFELKV